MSNQDTKTRKRPRSRGAFGRGRDVVGDLWDWRWLLVILAVAAALGRLAEALGLI